MGKSLPYVVVAIILALFLSGYIFSPPEFGINYSNRQESEGYKWGAYISSFPLNITGESFRSDRVEEELRLAKKLGVGYCRFNLVTQADPQSQKIIVLDELNDQMVELITENNCVPVMVLEAGDAFDKGTLEDSYAAAYQLATYTAKRYENKVKYYQLLNEITGAAIWKAGDSGEALADLYGYQYNKNKYERVKAWLKGLADGITANDPSAKKIVTGHWAWYSLFDYLIKDGFNSFDIIGWAWYSPDGSDPTNLKIANIGQEFQINLNDELAKFGKEIWIIESNRDHGSYDVDGKGEDKQAEFIGSLLKNIYYQDKIKGYFIFPFIDTPPEINTTREDDQWGIVSIKKDSQGIYQFDQPKSAFWVYRQFIIHHH